MNSVMLITVTILGILLFSGCSSVSQMEQSQLNHPSIEKLLSGVAMMFFYSMGFLLIILVLGLGLLGIKNLPRSGNWLGYIHKMGATALVIVGQGYIVYGLDGYFFFL